LVLRYVDDSGVPKYPTPVIDLIWHAHMLHPQQYRTCISEILVHHPGRRNTDEDSTTTTTPPNADLVTPTVDTTSIMLHHFPESVENTLKPTFLKLLRVREWKELWISEFGTSIGYETIITPDADYISRLSDILLWTITNYLSVEETVLFCLANRRMAKLMTTKFWRRRIRRVDSKFFVSTIDGLNIVPNWAFVCMQREFVASVQHDIWLANTNKTLRESEAYRKRRIKEQERARANEEATRSKQTYNPDSHCYTCHCSNVDEDEGQDEHYQELHDATRGRARIFAAFLRYIE